jgi:hypothetical protein
MLSTPYALGLQYHRALQASFTIDFARYALLRACRHDVVAVSATCTARLHNPRRTCAAPALQMWLNVSPVKTSGPMDLLRRVLCCLCESVLEAVVGICGGGGGVGIGHEAKRLHLHTARPPSLSLFVSFAAVACSIKWGIDTPLLHRENSASCHFDSPVPCRELLPSRHPAPAASQHRNNVSQR